MEDKEVNRTYLPYPKYPAREGYVLSFLSSSTVSIAVPPPLHPGSVGFLLYYLLQIPKKLTLLTIYSFLWVKIG
ncbi:hypothetical protein MTBPR1_20261 [Candidatus Terasakiella magnetica]|uniref:Uncharacterized protein n=1 Tax=Candidatus Terasakiella magnetica TaxID=1867952 RepID=A0A1C3RGJ1_9PROT|nr:hypothetical protein MTBPR1_20261 [Candidatus Terasakiella magnetica]